MSAADPPDRPRDDWGGSPAPGRMRRRRGWPVSFGQPMGSPFRASDAVERELHHVEGKVPAWLRPTEPENRLPVLVAILVAVVLQFAVETRFGIKPRWMLPGVELVLLAVLVVINPVKLTRRTRVERFASKLLVLIITLGNAASAAVLDYDIVDRSIGNDAALLLGAGSAIYVTNIIAFGIWFWELDRGGSFERARATTPYPDFLFPQMTAPDMAPPDWEPRFVDYLYVSFTNVVAFSPTDTLPLSRWTKIMMALEATVALSVVGLVVARAVNVLH